jgi:iron complex outermembrane receptor protein
LKPLRTLKAILSGALSLCAFCTAASAQGINIPAENLKKALDDYIRQSGIQLIYNADDVAGVTSRGVHGVSTAQALDRMLSGTGMVANRDKSGAVIISRAAVRHAAEVAPDTQPSESVVVTGTRILDDTQFSPPVTTVTVRELMRLTPSSVPDGLNKMPIFAPAQTSNSTTSGANGRGFRPNGNFLDLRGLGPNRTLVLEDGRRVPATFYDGTVDANTLPQMLVQRVEIVTGGASAVYGSDAVTGVVNFILDRHFDGFKAVAQAGVSQYGDAKSFRLGVAGGQDLLDRGHVIWSLEVYDRDAITDEAARPYGGLGAAIVGSGSAAVPFQLVTGIRKSDASFGGLVTSGPFAGQQFLGGGTLAPFNPGTPTPTGGAAIGGDGGIVHNEYLLPVINTAQGFGRFDYALTPSLDGYVQASYALTRTYEANQIIFNTPSAYPVTIYSGNAYLGASQQAVLKATGTDSFTLNRFDDELSRRLAMKYRTGALAVTAGLEGTAFGAFHWDAYYTHGETRTELSTPGNVNAERFYAAIDAVRDPAGGAIVCRAALAAPGAFPGCVPLDLFGASAPSQAAIGYVEGTTSWTARNSLDDFGANISGTVFNGWAGPLKIAVGGEYRLQALDLTTSVPDLTFNPQNLRVGGVTGTTIPPGNLKWFKETLSSAKGANSVEEADVELNLPLASQLPLMEYLALDAGYRFTSYSTSGRTDTWKLGLEWQMLDDLRLRGARSQDIRALTLFDLFQAPLISSSGINDPLTNTSGSVNTSQAGNRALKPEVAHNTTVGLIYTPQWLRDFSASVDYFHINIDNAIGTVTGNNPITQNLCLASGGASPLCGLIVRPISYNDTSPANFPLQFFQLKENLAKTYSEGLDIEANYQADLGVWDPALQGGLRMRLLWTHQSTLKTQTLPGTLVTDAAGTAQTPVDRLTFTASYLLDDFTLDILERFQSSFRQNVNQTLVFAIPDVRPYYQTDIGLSYNFTAAGEGVTGFLDISNLFNVQGDVFQTPGYTGSPGLNYPVGPGADLIGRTFTIGLRLDPG